MTQVHEAHSSEHEQAAALYALGLLDDGDRWAFEKHLAGCSRCQQVMAEDSETVGLLLDDVPGVEPPPEFRSHLMNLVDLPAEPNGHRAEPIRLTHRRTRSFVGGFRIKALVLAAALMATFASGLAAGQRYTANQVLFATPLQSLSGPGSAIVVIRASGVADLELRGLPNPPPGRVYEAWTLDANGTALMAGVYDDGDGTYRLDQSPLGRTLEITLEAAPGSERPTSAPIFSERVVP